jgi:hypothetical protein
MRPFIIFRGTGKRVEAEEAAELDALGITTKHIYLYTQCHTHRCWVVVSGERVGRW